MHASAGTHSAMTALSTKAANPLYSASMLSSGTIPSSIPQTDDVTVVFLTPFAFRVLLDFAVTGPPHMP